jgi:SAM-dependent methyltransferase
MPRFLHVGCGRKGKAETTRDFAGDAWQEIRLDIDERTGPDVIGTMTNMSAIADSSMDGLYSSHSIEHLYHYEVPQALREFRRVIKPDGFAVITCPDMQSICALVAEGKLAEPAYDSPAGPIAAIDMIYGYRPSIFEGEHFMAHRTGFTKQTLIDALRESSFEAAIAQRRGAPFYELWAIATRRLLPAEDMIELARRHFPGLSAASRISQTPAAA